MLHVVGISKGNTTTVDCHRIVWQVIAYQQGVRIQFFAMTQFISRVLKIIPALRWWVARILTYIKYYLRIIQKNRLLLFAEGDIINI